MGSQRCINMVNALHRTLHRILYGVRQNGRQVVYTPYIILLVLNNAIASPAARNDDNKSVIASDQRERGNLITVSVIASPSTGSVWIWTKQSHPL